MAYYPNNFYQNYQYGGYPQMSQISQSPMVNSLQGKVVDGVEIVKATDVPFGSFGIFPKGDFGEIYLKTWNNNGTTSITIYKPIIEEETKKENKKPNKKKKKINNIENQLTDLLNKISISPSIAAVSTEQPIKKEVNPNVRKF